MKIRKLIFTTLVLFILPAYAYSSSLDLLRISLIQGDVQVKTEDTPEWVPAAINMPLRDGDILWVPESGRAELQLRDGTYVRLDENSSLEILTMKKDSFQFYLTTGHAYVNFSGLRDSLLQMDTPVSSIRAYDRSKFGVDVTGDGNTDISVFKGTVYAESRSGRTRVSAGKTLSVGEDFFAGLSPLGSSDEWERWNRGRDSKLEEGRYGSRYLPDELDAYSHDLDENGRWVYTRDYGYVWTPTVIVSAGWAPYRIGRWVWIGGDYVWVSYEPWGWVPYHYGRWTHVVSIGWAWVPPVRGAVYWGPGYVGWVHTPAFVSWVPLAPGDIYYGHGYYGPGSVNIFNIDIHKTVIRNVYKNVYINNAVTVVHHDTFITGKPVDVRIKENPFLRERLSIGRPSIKPEKRTLMPVIKDVPLRKQPPQPIRNIQVRELKKERPLVKERTLSVLRPESPQKTMPIRTFKQPGSLKAGLYRGKESAPERQIQPGGKISVPLRREMNQTGLKRQSQPSEKQKSEVKTIERQKKITEPFAGKKQERTAATMEKRSIPDVRTRQIQPSERPQIIEGGKIEKTRKKIQPSGKQQGLDSDMTEKHGKIKESLVERQKDKAADSRGSHFTIQRSIKEHDQTEDVKSR